MKKYGLLSILLLIHSIVFAQVVQFSFTGATGSPSSYAADSQPSNGSVTDFTRGTGIGAVSSSNNFGGNNWTSTSSLDANDYFSFTITANVGFVLNLSSIELDEVRSSTGIRTWALRSSLDAFSTDIAVFNVPDDANTRSNQTIALNESFYNLSGSVEFRIYGYAAESSAGTWRVDNVQVFGTISTPDTAPPTLNSASTLINTQIDVFFNESVTQSTAENVSNYTISNGIGTPTAAVRNSSNFSQVTLTISGTLTNNQNYTITANNINDFAGNTQTNTQTSFTFLEISNAASKDLVINEIMADESPQIALPSSEYVEIFNRSTKNINLKNYTLNTKIITNNNYILPAGAYVLLCPAANDALFSGNVLGLSSWDALTNSGETITLTDTDNALDIDQVSYTDDWYKDSNKDDGGWSLELINPTLPCSDEANWQASTNANGGTPSTQNSVFSNTPDTQAPTLVNTFVVSADIIRLVFSEAMNETSLLAGSYTLTGGINVAGISIISNKEIQLNLSSGLVAGDIYTLTINALQDCSNNNLASNTSVQIGLGLAPTFNQILITEILADPEPRVGLPEQEFLELYNRSDKVISLKNCKLTDATSSVLLPNINILPKQYIVLTNSSVLNDFSAYANVYGINSFVSLNNDGERLSLYNAQNQLIFTINFSSDWYTETSKAEGGWSLEMIDTDNPCGEANNWQASNNTNGGTPTEENSVKNTNPDNTAPKLLRADAIDNQTLILNFNEKMDSLSLANGTYTIDKGISITAKSIIAPDFKQVVLVVSPALQTREKYTITLQSLQDCSGNLITDANFADFGVAEQADSLDILLNEILFNPRTGGADFVELYNNSDKYINLKNWQLARWVDNALDSKKIITEDNYVMPPKTFLALSDNIVNIQNNYPLSEGKPFLELSSMPSYNDDQGTVIVIDNLDRISQRFDYQDDYHFQLLDDEEGVSLERLGFELPTNEASSWFSAASSVGFATPGYANSQNKIMQSQTGTISVAPKVFTPNNDSRADFTSINYQLSGQGNVANVEIYDAQGRLIKYLARNQTLANEGSLIWDGSNENGGRVRRGYYLIRFEIFDLSGKKEIFKESVAVTFDF